MEEQPSIGLEAAVKRMGLPEKTIIDMIDKFIKQFMGM